MPPDTGHTRVDASIRTDSTTGKRQCFVDESVNGWLTVCVEMEGGVNRMAKKKKGSKKGKKK
jgi:hypothetical protein